MRNLPRFLESVPPLVQVIVLVALGILSSVSITARFWPGLGKAIFDLERDPKSLGHVLQYTVLPAIVFVVALVAVIGNWDSTSPWLGSWTASEVAATVGMSTYAFAACGAAAFLHEKSNITKTNHCLACLPLMLMLSGIVAMVLAVLTMPAT